MFIWKASNDLLPTKMNLLKCGVVSDALCSICTRDDETVNHILWSCLSGQDVWRCGPKKLQKGMNGVHNFFFHLFETLMECCDVTDLELMVVVARKIWFQRNGVVDGGEFTLP
jgi:hypothetical protein